MEEKSKEGITHPPHSTSSENLEELGSDSGNDSAIWSSKESALPSKCTEFTLTEAPLDITVLSLCTFFVLPQVANLEKFVKEILGGINFSKNEFSQHKND